jgi:hypothetical protein
MGKHFWLFPAILSFLQLMLEIRLKNSLFGQTMEKLELNRPV